MENQTQRKTLFRVQLLCFAPYWYPDISSINVGATVNWSVWKYQKLINLKAHVTDLRTSLGESQISVGYISIVAMLVESYAAESVWLFVAILINGPSDHPVVIFFGDTATYIEVRPPQNSGPMLDREWWWLDNCLPPCAVPSCQRKSIWIPKGTEKY